MITITYTPKRDEYPIFKIIAKDDTGLITEYTVQNLLVCDCKSLDQANTCLYDSILTVKNPSVSVVACNCEKYYTGKL